MIKSGREKMRLERKLKATARRKKLLGKHGERPTITNGTIDNQSMEPIEDAESFRSQKTGGSVVRLMNSWIALIEAHHGTLQNKLMPGLFVNARRPLSPSQTSVR